MRHEKGVSSNEVWRRRHNCVRHTKNRDKVQQQLQQDSSTQDRKRIRASKYEDVDEALFRWFSEVRAQNVPVSGPMLQAKARCFGCLLGHDDFNPLNGWIQRFKDRHGITCKVVSGEAGEVDDASIQAWLNLNVEAILSTHADRDAYNADEAGFFYNLLPNRTLALKGEPCTGRKASKERITVLFCANMDGSDERRLLLIGKSARPRCFKKQKCLPVTYKANSRASMTRELFSCWLRKFDEDMVAEKRSVVLILDNCTAHNNQAKLTAINLKYLPPNTTAKSQPLDQGVIATVKAHYRKRICERVVLSLQRKEPLKVNLWGAIDMITASWWQTKASTISKCFRKAGFVRCDDAPVALDEPSDDAVDTTDVWSDLVSNEFVSATDTFEGYLNEDCDDESPVCEPAATDEAIVAAVRGADGEGASASEEESEDDEIPPVTTNEALECLAKLKAYCGQNSPSEQALKCLSVVEDEAVQSAVKRQRQAKITAFFR